MRPPSDTSLYQRVGGRATIAAIVDDAVRNIATDPRISQRFRHADAPGLKERLEELLCERSGGPCVYRGRNMAEAHDGMRIRDDEFDALIDDIARSLDKFKVPAAERAEALKVLRQMRSAIVGH
ncbi:group I truncated hemoglobin [Aquabacterium humicola]|uniref:group I truncated hemoglobin n=1 Tax=Aquabacterium humicola TaxID=3237377 RepID=UPI002543758E|nr:group 1 truncated hemoglobin [Rubrivivax pictus]